MIKLIDTLLQGKMISLLSCVKISTSSRLLATVSFSTWLSILSLFTFNLLIGVSLDLYTKHTNIKKYPNFNQYTKKNIKLTVFGRSSLCSSISFLILPRYVACFDLAILLHCTCKSTFSNRLAKALSLFFSTSDKKLHSPAAFKSFFLSLFNRIDAKHLLFEGIIIHNLPLKNT